MVTVMQRIGTPNARHNLDNNYRRFLENVDSSLSQYNEVLRHRKVEDIYAEYLQHAFDDFNKRQKRKDRRLDVKYSCQTYLEYQRALDAAGKSSKNKIDQKGRPPIREIIWQFGNPAQGFGSNGQTEKSRQKIKEMLMEVQCEAELRYPQFLWGDLILHADETSIDADNQEHGSIHLHSSFVPVCLKNKQGPEKQVAFERCLHEMGFATFESWKHDLDDIMERVLKNHGMERTVMENHETHQNSKEFHRQQKVVAQTKTLETKLDNLQLDVRNIETEVGHLTKTKSALSTEVCDLVKTAKLGRSIVDSLNNEKFVAEQQLHQVTHALQTAHLETQELTSDIEILDEEIAVRQAMIDGYEEQIGKLQDDLHETEHELANARDELTYLQTQIAQAKELLMKFKVALNTLKGTAEGRLLQVQEWLDKTLQRISRPSAEEFKKAWADIRKGEKDPTSPLFTERNKNKETFSQRGDRR